MTLALEVAVEVQRSCRFLEPRKLLRRVLISPTFSRPNRVAEPWSGHIAATRSFHSFLLPYHLPLLLVILALTYTLQVPAYTAD